jgi:lipopolysaccharide export system protein LptA
MKSPASIWTARIRKVPGYTVLLATGLCLFWAMPGFAQAPAVTETRDQPVDISADQALEWDRQNARYVARGNARAVQGDMTLKADELIAAYDADSGSGVNELTEIKALRNVEILDGKMTLYGQQGNYDLVTGLARLTGDDLRMVSEQAVITAKDYFEYDGNAQKVIARGDAVVVQGDDRLETAYFIAHINENADGDMVVKTIEAPEKVVIITPKERITGDRGTYDTVNEIAILRGNVTITQGENILTGERAEVNTKTGISRLFAPKDEQGLPGRVRGVFYPKSE